MTGLSLVLHQFRYDSKTFWRDPAAVGFTIAFPLVFLFLFVTIFGNETTNVGGVDIQGSTYYVPSILTLAVVGATFFNLAITLTDLRESGVLKRVSGTPLPGWAFLAGRVMTSTVVTVLLAFVVCGIGALVYGVRLPTGTLPGLVVTLMLGAATFASLGFAVSGVVPTPQAAPAVVNLIALPLEFLSGLFVQSEALPGWMRTVAGLFPVKPMFEGMLAAFTPGTAAPGLQWDNLGVLTAWLVVGVVLARLTFRWTPRS